jgi:hypothetical protein
MTETPFRIESIPWRRVFPWLHLSRAIWIALDLRKLCLAAIGLMLISAGSLAIDQLPFSRGLTAQQPADGSSIEPGNRDAPQEGDDQARSNSRWPWNWSLGYTLPRERSALESFAEVIDRPGRILVAVTGNWRIVLHPVLSVVEPARRLFRSDTTWPALADAVTRLLWALIVWSIFAGAIGRIAAVQFARDQHVGVGAALRFALERFSGYLSAPLLPLAGIAVLWALCVIGGWLGRIPWGVGETVLGALWGLELVFGLMMMVVLLGVAAGWPLMFATIGVEGTDGFDGLSRMYNYVFERPLYYAWQIVVALVLGSAGVFFVWMMAQSLMHLAAWGVSWGLGEERLARLVAEQPPLLALATSGEIPTTPGAGSLLIQLWGGLVALLVMGFVYSYFWTSSTIIYFVLRRSVDANDFDEVYIGDEPEPDNLLPLVGAAAMGETDRIQEPELKPDAAREPPIDLTP